MCFGLVGLVCSLPFLPLCLTSCTCFCYVHCRVNSSFDVVYSQDQELTPPPPASLQIPYLISLAVLVNTYLPDYPFTPKPTFRLLRKLDSVFASLLTGEDADSGSPLSGFETRRNIISMTEKVRIKSIAETCRVTVVEARETVDELVDGDDDSDDDDEEMEDVYGTRDDRDYYVDAPGRWEMETARVYEKTIQLLGDELGRAGEFCDENMAAGDEVDGGCQI